MKKSTNTQGNPYHDESGKFTSKNEQGGGSKVKSNPLMDLFGGLNKSMEEAHKEENDAISKIKQMGFKEKDEEEERAERETKSWLKAGYSERMYDYPTTIPIVDDNEENQDYSWYELDVTPEDVVEFLSIGTDLTEEEKDVILENSVIPYRFVEDGDFDEEMFIEWFREKHHHEIREIMENIALDKKYGYFW